jgi:hypothetical protein
MGQDLHRRPGFAVHAGKIAPIRDGYAEIIDEPVMSIQEGHVKTLSQQRGFFKGKIRPRRPAGNEKS